MINFEKYKKKQQRKRREAICHEYAEKVFNKISVNKIINVKINGKECELKIIKVMSADTALKWYESLIEKDFHLDYFSPFRFSMTYDYDDRDRIVITSKQKLSKDMFFKSKTDEQCPPALPFLEEKKNL